MHYANQDIQDDDYDEDMKLPFKKHNVCPGTSLVSFVPANDEEFTFRLSDTGREIYSSYQDVFLPSTSLSSIWQPPKAC